jgi:hypothetical protein
MNNIIHNAQQAEAERRRRASQQVLNISVARPNQTDRERLQRQINTARQNLTHARHRLTSTRNANMSSNNREDMQRYINESSANLDNAQRHLNNNNINETMNVLA